MLVVSWIRSLLYLAVFATILCGFHIIHLITLRLSNRLYWLGFRCMNSCIVYALRFAAGIRFSFGTLPTIDSAQPIVIISNHQSMFDIPMIAHLFKSFDVRFVAKKELSHGIPSVSLCLRRGGHLLIDRAKGREAIRAMRDFAKTLLSPRDAVCIFPEGTRARTGAMKEFKPAGVLTLLRNLPGAVVVPLLITDSWRIVRHKMLPIPRGIHVHCLPLEPLVVPETVDDEFVSRIEALIRAELARREGLA